MYKLLIITNFIAIHKNICYTKLWYIFILAMQQHILLHIHTLITDSSLLSFKEKEELLNFVDSVRDEQILLELKEVLEHEDMLIIDTFKCLAWEDESDIMLIDAMNIVRKEYRERLFKQEENERNLEKEQLLVSFV